MGKATFIMILGASVVVGVMNIQLNGMTARATESLVAYHYAGVARGIANEAASYVLGIYADSASFRVSTPAALPSSVVSDEDEGEIKYTFKDTTIRVDAASVDAVKLSVWTEFKDQSHEVVVYASRTLGMLPSAVRGAFTADGKLDRAIGQLVIDGRDHDRLGNLLSSQPGVPGVSVGTSFTNSYGAQIGGTGTNGNDYAPSLPENPYAVEQQYVWGADFPTSPDALMSLDEGTLKTFAQTGTNGSQYVTKPKDLRYPLRGITYVELPSGVSWKNAWLGTDPEGLLIVHNSAGNARIENIASRTPFKGMIIADYMFHIHLDVIGGLVFLSRNQEVRKKCTGNDDHQILFSSEAIQSATYLATEKGTGWRGRVPVFGWRE